MQKGWKRRRSVGWRRRSVTHVPRCVILRWNRWSTSSLHATFNFTRSKTVSLFTSKTGIKIKMFVALIYHLGSHNLWDLNVLPFFTFKLSSCPLLMCVLFLLGPNAHVILLWLVHVVSYRTDKLYKESAWLRVQQHCIQFVLIDCTKTKSLIMLLLQWTVGLQYLLPYV